MASEVRNSTVVAAYEKTFMKPHHKEMSSVKFTKADGEINDAEIQDIRNLVSKLQGYHTKLFDQPKAQITGELIDLISSKKKFLQNHPTFAIHDFNISCE